MLPEMLGVTGIASAVPIADSFSEFSTIQGQDSWSYGFFNAGAAPGAAYTSGAFVAFDTFNVGSNRWEASAAQIGDQNNDFLSLDAAGGHPTGIGPDAQDSIIWAVRRYTSRSGLSLNAEQQISPDVGMFVRAGVASSNVEPYEFTDIDRTVAAGLSLSGKLWGRPDDTVGLAGVVNGA